MTNEILNHEYATFLEELKNHVFSSRYKAARAVNSELILLYHHIGTQILHKQNTKSWGAKVIQTLSKDLSHSFPEMKGFSIANLHNMRRFAELYPDSKFLQQVAGELPWYHHVVLMEKVKEPEFRLFYIKHAIQHGWSRSVMIHQIELGLHKRQGKAVTNFKDTLPSPQSDLAHSTLKDPYIFDFLSIGSEAHEREVEKTLIVHIEKFLVELGTGFAFVGRQKLANKTFSLICFFTI